MIQAKNKSHIQNTLFNQVIIWRGFVESISPIALLEALAR